MDDSSQAQKIDPRDGQIDFDHYSVEQLKDLEYSIDRSAFPENYKNLLAALNRMEPPTPQPSASEDPVSGWFSARQGLFGWLQAKFARSPVYGTGSLAVDSTRLTLNAWQRTWLGVPIESQCTRDIGAVRNVVMDGGSIRFEIQREWLPAERLLFQPDDPNRIPSLLDSLPQVATSGFRERWSEIHNFDQSLQNLGGRCWATPAIICLNFIAFVAMSIITKKVGQFNPPELLAWGANFGPLTVNGQWWRLITALFVHFSVLHILINMWAFWNIGRLSERLFGSGSLIFLYVACGCLASLTSIAWNPAISSVGASGAIFGIFGSFLAFLWRQRRQIPPRIIRRHWLSTLVFVLFNLINGALTPGIDNAAHVGGFLSGVVLGYLLARPIDRAVRSRFPIKQSLVAAGFIGAVVFLAVWQVKGIGSELTIPERYARQHEALVNGVLQNLQLWNSLAQRATAGNISDAELGQRFEQDIVPFWETQNAQLEKENATLNGPAKPYALLFAEFVKVRYEWAAAVAAISHGNDPNSATEAQKLLKQNNRLDAQLERLNIRARMDHRPRALAASPVFTKMRELFADWRCVGTPNTTDPKDGPALRDAFGCKAQRLFMAGDYARLDSWMTQTMDSLEDLPDGSSSYEGIVSGLSDLFSSEKLAPEAVLEHTADWRRRVKSSVMADLVEAMFLRDWAWKARGSGYANTISAQNLVLYEYRSEMAAAALAEVARRATHNPLWLTLSMNVGLDQAKDKQDLKEMFDREHSDRDRYYFPLYRGMLRILMPRWGGSYEEVDRFINDANDHAGRERGYERYAQLYSMYAQLEGDDLNLFADTPAYWSSMRKGYLGLVKRYPTSHSIVNSFANFACRAGDKVTYNRVRDDMAKNVVSTSWSAKYSIESCDKLLGVAPPSERILSLGGVRLGMTRQELLVAKGNPVIRMPEYWVYDSVDSRRDGVVTVVFSSTEAAAVVRAIAYSGDELSAPKELPFLDGLTSAQVLEQYGRQLKGNLTLEGEMTFTFPNGLYVNTYDEKVYRYGILALPTSP